MLVRMRARARRQELRELWPDVVDNLASSVRAGLSLGEALTQIGVRGPDALRRPFQRFAEEYRATGRFNDCLDALKNRLADPVGDRIIESIRLAREVGGSDLGRLLRTLSAFLREDIRTRSELEARQSFTVNGARVAIATPFAVLIFMAFQPDLVAAYNSFAGFIVLGIGVGLMLLAYRIMLRIGRLPEERRVLR
jgi:tight adherence protein B